MKYELNHAGFQDCVVEDIAGELATKKYLVGLGPEGAEGAEREIEMFNLRTKKSLDNYKQSNMTTGKR